MSILAYMTQQPHFEGIKYPSTTLLIQTENSVIAEMFLGVNMIQTSYSKGLFDFRRGNAALTLSRIRFILCVSFIRLTNANF